MKVIFNRYGNGAEELVSVLGLVDADTDITKWIPIFPLSIRRLTAIVGEEVYREAERLYYQNEALNEDEQELIRLVQQPLALFTWLKVIPTLDAQHGNSGRQRRLGENEKGLTALQEFKDEENILNLAYESVDNLVAHLEERAYDFWNESAKKKELSKLLIRSKQEFDEYYMLGSHRLFLTLVPIMKEVQDRYIIPAVTTAVFDKLLGGDKSVSELKDRAARPLALLTMAKAVERLPIEVLPEGVVSVQQIGTIKEKQRAEADMRKAVAKSLTDDAERDLLNLWNEVKSLLFPAEETDAYISKPQVQSKGVTF
ncbi:MAG: hypothetical protein Q3992_02220 [Bacteroides sp.]|nr:hypothetical protein [Bacteroides sp.]